MSNISTTNIDGTYPIAGQDNSTQGFRDNFTNIKNNFVTAASEITDLQQKVILKAPLEGTALNNDFNGALLSNANTVGFREIVNELGSLGNEPLELDFAEGNVHTATLTGPVTVSFANIPNDTNPPSEIRIKLIVTINNIAHTLTIPNTVNISRVNVSEITTPLDHLVTFTGTGTYELEFVALSNPSPTIYLNSISLQTNVFVRDTVFQNPVNFGNDVITGGRFQLTGIESDPASGTNLLSTVSTTWFSTAGAETATLPAGLDGQIRTLICFGYVGNMVITVNNAAWGGGGTLTFTAAGQSCILQYIAGIVNRWFVIGNNGVTISS
jgi:hypothetical protein